MGGNLLLNNYQYQMQIYQKMAKYIKKKKKINSKQICFVQVNMKKVIFHHGGFFLSN